MAKPLFISPLIRWLIIGLVIVIFVLVVRLFCVDSYKIATDSMADSMRKGEYVLVNKLKTGSNPGRNRAVLFKSPLLQDKSQKPLLLARCIGMPGDTILVSKAGYFVNGELIPPSPYEFREYYFSATDHEVFSQVLTVLELNSREIEERGDSCMIQLTSFEEYQLREELPDNFILSEILDDVVEYTLIVPVANRSYPLDENSFVACREAIVREVGNSIEYRNDKLLTDGGETDFFIFRQNYYWLLSDNPHEAVDSRQLGFIPADHIVGNVWYRWYSPESERRFKSVY